MPTPFLNGKHVVFGKVLDDNNDASSSGSGSGGGGGGGGSSMDVVRKVENTRLRGERPVQEVLIAECGEM